ncbi:hypothetical protein QOZ88_16675 [Blastococcus sp. BMG 814]|uniref:Uncharacterized protein n=1 Tax=Blastococcus carthaginiensis TaxID=3050034 RepID=A0ABT9IGP8_9ACTN|nr:hypothetical protein [Blastococcus carthaginiensis]MDP5184270.1 hypothetical protein [Blastococcus carthaginiensis]
MTEPGTRSPVPQEGWRRVLRWWGRAGAFLGGLVVGVVLVGLLSEGNVLVAAPVPTNPDAALPAFPDRGAGEEGGATGQVTIDDDCLRAVNAAQDIAQLIDELGEAIADFNATRLDEIVRELQPLQRRLQTSIDACEVEAGTPEAPSGAVPTGAAPPTGSVAPESPDTTD